MNNRRNDGGISITSRSKALNRLQQGTYTNDGEGIDWKYYDTLAIPTTAQTMQFFTVGQGGTKTIADTNMTLNGQIPNGQHMKITHIRATYRSATGIVSLAEQLDLNTFVDTSVLEFVILNKSPMLQTKMSDIMGLSMMAPVAVTTGSYASSQFGIFSSTYRLRTPIILAGLTSFKVPLTLTQTPPTSVQGDSLALYLGGRLVRTL
jgi:hypothetical protein